MKRTVTTDFWLDSKVEEMGSIAKFVLLYLLTSPKTNLAGCYEVSYKRLSNDTGLTAKQAENAIAELCEANVIGYCAETNEVLICNWDKYNWTSSTKLDKPLVANIDAVKCASFKSWLAEKYEQVRGREYPNKDTVLANLDRVSAEDSKCGYPSIPIPISKPIPIGDRGLGEGGEQFPEQQPDPKPKKHRHGEYGNVLLTDGELEKLKARFPDDWQERIDRLSGYIGSKGDRYKSHYITILNWARNEQPKEAKDDARFGKYR